VDFAGADEHTRVLIQWRVDNEALFTGKRNTAIKGFKYTKQMYYVILFKRCRFNGTLFVDVNISTQALTAFLLCLIYVHLLQSFVTKHSLEGKMSAVQKKGENLKQKYNVSFFFFFNYSYIPIL